MPNHVTNILTIKGDTNKISTVLAEIKKDDEEIGTIDFNKIIPMPESLGLTSGSIVDETIFWALSKMTNTDCAKYINLLKSTTDILDRNQLEALRDKFSTNDIPRIAKNAAEYTPNETEKKLGILNYESLGRMYLENLEKYGTTDWYDWCIANWGTKWNAYEEELIDNNSISFQTAWSTPLEIIEKLSSQYPDLEFEVKYADENYGYNVGIYEFKNGEITREYKPEGGSPEANKLAEEILGYPSEFECDEPNELDTVDTKLLNESNE